MKKLITLLMVMAMLLCLAACGKDETENNTKKPNTSENTDSTDDNGPAQDSFGFTFRNFFNAVLVVGDR